MFGLHTLDQTILLGIGIAIDVLSNILLAISEDFCDSSFHGKCHSLCRDIVCRHTREIVLKGLTYVLQTSKWDMSDEI